MFLDASCLVPFVVKQDQWHTRLLGIVSRLQAAGRTEFITSNWTYYEALAVSTRGGRRFAHRVRQFVEAQVSLHAVNPEQETEAVRRFFAWDDKTASVVDHANLLVAQDECCAAILSFDADFIAIAGGTGLRVLR